MIQQIKVFFFLFVSIAWFATPAAATIIIHIEPGDESVIWTVSWDSYDGSSWHNDRKWKPMNPDTGELPDTGDDSTDFPWGAAPIVPTRGWHNLGDVFTSVYKDGIMGAFGDGVNGVVSNESGWAVGADHDGSGNDDVFIFRTAGPPWVPPSGRFTLTVPGANIDKYIVGEHISPHARISVVPEPSAFFLFLGVVGLGTGWQWTRKGKASTVSPTFSFKK